MSGGARPLFKVDGDNRIKTLMVELAKERRLRAAAEANAKRWHALYLKARIDALPVKGDTR